MGALWEKSFCYILTILFFTVGLQKNVVEPLTLRAFARQVMEVRESKCNMFNPDIGLEEFVLAKQN